MPQDWLVPDWPSPVRVRAVFTTRSGGVSAVPFNSFNLGDHVRDNPAAVATNRVRLADAMGARPVFLKQVHGTAVATLAADTPDEIEADACISTQPGVACTIMVADCLPVLFTNMLGTVVAAAHAGWRGLAGEGAELAGQGVLEATFKAFVKAVQGEDPTASRGSVAAHTLVWLGPCIGPEAFEVGPEVLQAFVAQRASAAACFSPSSAPGKYRANLQALARQRLLALGITKVSGNDGTPAWCTVSQDSRFFSHRRDAVQLGSTGRMAACIWLN
ncbi:peptidoglycan editing factor PgeF [Hydrogenophaga sp. A37]|uniref:peptidoglycan editing factor PgeF n=1 Tax=Hydrogenophaga sp. A37 TaxID=1945864 RepID=UPI0009842EB8|nr:peptidoglycan editing factor PgeF [Hydrogenophaga sp. A37]